MKSAESIITLLIMVGVLLLIVTHAGGFSTDLVAGGNVLDKTLLVESGKGRSAGVNVPTGVSKLGL